MLESEILFSRYEICFFQDCNEISILLASEFEILNVLPDFKASITFWLVSIFSLSFSNLFFIAFKYSESSKSFSFFLYALIKVIADEKNSFIHCEFLYVD